MWKEIVVGKLFTTPVYQLLAQILNIEKYLFNFISWLEMNNSFD